MVLVCRQATSISRGWMVRLTRRCTAWRRLYLVTCVEVDGAAGEDDGVGLGLVVGFLDGDLVLGGGERDCVGSTGTNADSLRE